MPAQSKAQRRLMAIAEHHPEELYSENKDVAKMGKESLHEFAKTKEKGKPEHVSHGRHKTSEHAPHGRKPHGRGGY